MRKNYFVRRRYMQAISKREIDYEPGLLSAPERLGVAPRIVVQPEGTERQAPL
jgi:hypothetical protein